MTNALEGLESAEKAGKKIVIEASIAQFLAATAHLTNQLAAIETIKGEMKEKEDKDISDLALMYDPTVDGVAQVELSEQLTKILKTIKEKGPHYFGSSILRVERKKTDASEEEKKKKEQAAKEKEEKLKAAAKVKNNAMNIVPKLFVNKPHVEEFVGFLTKKQKKAETDKMTIDEKKKFVKLKQHCHYMVETLLENLITSGTIIIAIASVFV